MHIEGGFLDFAYNGAASNADYTYTDGRGPTVLGGATGNGVDASSLSIVAVGDFHTNGKDIPSAYLVENVASLIVRWMELGHVTPNYSLRPHRDFYATACCGDRLVSKIPEIKALVEYKRTKEEEVLDMAEWWKYFNRTKPMEYHPVVEFVQRGLAALDLYGGPINARKNGRTSASWEAFEKATRGTDNNDKAGPKSWDAFLTAVYSDDTTIPLELALAIDAAYEELAKAKFIAGTEE
jgi:hypothetical protein